MNTAIKELYEALVHLRLNGSGDALSDIAETIYADFGSDKTEHIASIVKDCMEVTQ